VRDFVGRVPAGLKRRLAPSGGRYPDFLGIGAQKSGTTWLSHNLQLHPGIWMPRLKELHYFDERIDDPRNPFFRLYGKIKGEGNTDRRWRRQLKGRLRHHREHFSREEFLWDLKYYAGAAGDGWYASLFGPGGGKVAGEVTPAYATLEPEMVARVYDRMPEAKIIFLMRNPVERAWSQLAMRFARSKKRDVGTVTRKELRRNFEREGSKQRTDYLRTLGNWSSFYPREQIFVGFLEDIHFFPERLLGSVYAFLGVDPSFEPRGAGVRVHARSTGRMLTRSAAYLSRLYLEELSRLDDRFGGYASFWRYGAEKLAADAPEEEFLPYPLWESVMWEEWIKEGAGRPAYQSGPLTRAEIPPRRQKA
jgi:Sulfotransferase family